MPRCRDCGATIVFEQTPRGRLRPIDPDTGTVHFATCEARAAARPSYPDDVCIRCGSLDVARGPGAATHFASLRCNDCGAFRWLRKPREAPS